MACGGITYGSYLKDLYDRFNRTTWLNFNSGVSCHTFFFKVKQQGLFYSATRLAVVSQAAARAAADADSSLSGS